MKEIEVKILEIDLEYITKKLDKLGAVKMFEGNITASYFDFPGQTLTLKNTFLRLRNKKGLYELTFKYKLGKEEAKIMEEYEINFTNNEAAMREILRGLGLIEVKQTQKHRISYALNGVHFELDSMPGIPTFLEIETTSLDKIKEIVLKLGYSMSDTKPWSGREVQEYYFKEIQGRINNWQRYIKQLLK